MTWEQIIKQSKDLLLVENSERRIEATRERISYAWCCRDLENLEYNLRRNNFQTLWLDYDLTRIWKIRHRVNTLNTIKKFDLNKVGIKLIVIHSWNPWGRLLLKKALKNTGIRVILKRHWKMF